MSKSSHRQPLDPEMVNPKIVLPRRYSQRGQQRRDLILDTAADLLVAGGTEAINTNAIADRAQIAVGSIYQYFANKEAILAALSDRYMQQLAANTLEALQQDVTGLDGQMMVDRVIDPMIAFERRHPAFRYLQASMENSGALAEGAQRMDQEILATIQDLLQRVYPQLEPLQYQAMARVMKALYKGISYLIHQEADILQTGGDVDVLLSSMKQLMVKYLATQSLISIASISTTHT
jgi:AcrR family transcriptional regulator